MIHIIKLDLDALPLGELPVTDLRHVKNEIYKHRRAVECLNDYRNVRARYQQRYNEKKKRDMRCPEPSIKEPCYFCYNGECYAEHWYECSKGFRKPHKGKFGNKNNRYCKKDKKK